MGADDISSFIVKGCAQLLCPVFFIFSISLESETIPAAWEISVVVSLHKSDDRSLVSSYRPVSLLCKLSKVYETILRTCLYAYFCRKVVAKKHGFIKKKTL